MRTVGVLARFLLDTSSSIRCVVPKNERWTVTSAVMSNLNTTVEYVELWHLLPKDTGPQDENKILPTVGVQPNQVTGLPFQPVMGPSESMAGRCTTARKVNVYLYGIREIL